jgi:hypothetical protein
LLENLVNSLDDIKKQYKLKMKTTKKINPTTKNALDIDLLILNGQNSLEKDSRHRFFIKTKMDDLTQSEHPYIMNFHLMEVQNVKDIVPKPKSFIL